jgi:hypothetical protein
VIEEASISDFLLRIPLVEGKIESGIVRLREGTLEPSPGEGEGKPHLPSLHCNGKSASLIEEGKLIWVDFHISSYYTVF